MKILIIDDEPMIREVLEKYFTQLNHTVDTASDGIECGAKLLENDYDVLIMDLMMPNQDGLKTIKYLKKGISDKNKNLKIIVITGSRQEDVKEFLEEYKVDCLYKPVDLKELSRLIGAK